MRSRVSAPELHPSTHTRSRAPVLGAKPQPGCQEARPQHPKLRLHFPKGHGTPEVTTGPLSLEAPFTCTQRPHQVITSQKAQARIRRADV